jgi:hypothetical protein
MSMHHGDSLFGQGDFSAPTKARCSIFIGCLLEIWHIIRIVIAECEVKREHSALGDDFRAIEVAAMQERFRPLGP